MNDFTDRTTPVIVSACRTPIGKFLGALAPKTAPELGAIAIREAIARAAIDPATIDEVVMGQVVQAGSGQAPGRQWRRCPAEHATFPVVRCHRDFDDGQAQAADGIAVEMVIVVIHPQPPVGPKRSVRIRSGWWPSSRRLPATVSTKPVGPQT